MAHRITVRTISGKPDSLKRDVKITFTLTPKQIHERHDAVAFGSLAFSRDSRDSHVFEWNRDLAFAAYEFKNQSGKAQCITSALRTDDVPAGRRVYVSNSLSRTGWGTLMSSDKGGQHLAVAEGHTWGSQSIALVKNISQDSAWGYLPIIAWQPVRGREYVGATPDLLLQAYVVDDAGYDRVILQANDMKHPIFPEPLSCDDLPDSLTWILTESPGGAIHLREGNPDQPNSEPEIDQWTKSFNEMKAQLDTLVQSLGNTQERLTAVEKSVDENKIELSAAQQTLSTVRDEISRLNRNMPEVGKFVASTARTEERLDAVERSIVRNREEFSSGQQVTAAIQSRLSRMEDQRHGGQPTTLADHRIPALEAKTNDMDETLGHVQDQLSAVRTRVDRLNRGVLAAQATADAAETSAAQGQDRISSVESAAGRAHKRLDIVEKLVGAMPEGIGPGRLADGQILAPRIRKPSVQTQDTSTAPYESPTTARRQLQIPDPNRRVPVMEAKLDRLEKSLGAMERRVPTIEEKAVRLERLFDGTQDEVSALRMSLGTTGDELAGLSSRVKDVEARMEHSQGDLWDQIEPSSPGVFPSQGRIDPL